jgi:hypothetical protein
MAKFSVPNESMSKELYKLSVNRVVSKTTLCIEEMKPTRANATG